ncbi:MAG: YeeE/YedE family protein, partial [Paracoccaceae bacterium]
APDARRNAWLDAWNAGTGRSPGCRSRLAAGLPRSWWTSRAAAAARPCRVREEEMTGVHFDWAWGMMGGLMIGIAAAMYLLINGRIMGASGIFGGLLAWEGHRSPYERIAFIGGLVTAPAAALLLQDVSIPTEFAVTGITSDWTVIVVGGLLVGTGTRMANGCTSGHGVCGMSRFSLRGIVATLTFLAAGMAAMAVLRHGLGVI